MNAEDIDFLNKRLIHTYDDLQLIEKICKPIFEDMGITNLGGIPITLEDSLVSNGEHHKYANHRNGRIYIKRGIIAFSALVAFVHEIGHEVTETGSFKNKIISESTARTFEEQFFKILKDKENVSMNMIRLDKRSTYKKYGFGYLVGSLITFNPLGKLIKKEYRKNLET